MYRMGPKYKAILMIALMTAVAIMIARYVPTSEQFTTKHEKAQTVYGWFTSNPTPSYANYRRDIGGMSNIVEYEDVMMLFRDRNLTLATVERAI